VWVPGDDTQAAIAEAVHAIDDLTAIAGTLTSETARARLRAQLEALDRRLVELESTPAREAGWEWRATGGTYREAWNQADLDGRREMLIRSGITFAARVVGGRGSKAREFHIRIPDGVFGPFEPVPEGTAATDEYIAELREGVEYDR
jgi:site-specific DNA recombinase